MLASSFHSDSHALCRQVISQFFVDDPAATIVPILGNEGFSGALIFRVTSEGRSYSLRRWPIDGPPPARLSGLHRLLELTWRLGVTPVAVPLRSREGSTLLKAGGHLWQLEPWMPGLADFHTQGTRTRLREVMRVLSGWHAAARTFTPTPAEHAWFGSSAATTSPGIEERYRAIRHYQQSAEQTIRVKLNAFPDQELKALLTKIWSHFQRLSAAVAQNLLQVASMSIPLQPCLRDVWHDHLLFTGDELTGLIDPTACRSENITTDLARLLGSLLEDNSTEWDFAIDCYQEFRPLSLDEFRLLRAFDASGVLLSGMTWLDWLIVQHKPFTNRRRVIDRLEMIIRRLEHLAGRTTFDS